MSRLRLHNWIFAIVLAAPLLVFFLGYLFNHAADLQPTGFIQYDNVSYIAYAHQYLDAGEIHLRYSNPFNDAAGTPIYFQPQSVFFALLLAIGVPAGWILIPFTLACAVVCFRLLMKIYDRLLPSSRQRTLHLWLLCWGGGLLTLAGPLAYRFSGGEGSAWNGLFLLDPESGWWGLNFGRSLLFSCEAYYHAVFLACIYCLLQKRWLAGFLLCFLLSVSHPFTGIELAGIVLAWSVVEFMVGRRSVPALFVAGSLAIVAFHAWYYLLYLPSFPEHFSVQEQYTLNWRLAWYRMIPAYAFVGLLALAAIARARIAPFFRTPSNRLLACWFAVAFFLANHEVVMQARQPVHFTRGYIWTSLFLLGLPALDAVTMWFRQAAGRWLTIPFVVLFLLDNALWIGSQATNRETVAGARYINPEQHELLAALRHQSNASTLVVSRDETVAYLSAICTSAYPWYSHPFTTPFAAQKKQWQQAFFTSGKPHPSWLNRNVLFITGNTDTAAIRTLHALHASITFQTKNYAVWKRGQ